ncbi:hypothetical protein HYFRA_00012665 [Hymenoscyphus fraxineus]|uniref:Yeast cell wall synthesis Kre9/Knh1-like N-terminal domain-containing protein n=1 Tax=Hymenoscyphus fraxineus TaxID=746836 RepID=A0A9N9PYG5_9HELO|nr:hypothetical protein HYFRA_00012665 [Hymenoscyphus fraxineus]
MQFSSALVAAAALAVANAVSFTNPAFNDVTAGQPFTFTWKDNQGPVTIRLKNGPSTDLKDVSVITSAQTGGSYVWNVPATLSQDTYAFDIVDSTGVPNYSSQFELIGGAAPSPSAPSASVSSAVSSVSASVSSVLSSVSASVTSVASSAIPTISSNTTTSAPTSAPTSGGNSTVTSGRPSSTLGSSASRTAPGGAATGTTTAAPSSGAADIASPLALVFLTVAALISLN